MNDTAAFAALLRSDVRYFTWKCFQTILPGTPYLPNWHVDAIVYQLMRVQAGEISRLLINQPPRSFENAWWRDAVANRTSLIARVRRDVRPRKSPGKGQIPQNSLLISLLAGEFGAIPEQYQSS